MFILRVCYARRGRDLDLLAWSALEEIGKNGSEVLAQKVVGNCYFHQVAFAFCDDTDDDDTHESHVTTPVSVLRNHAARVFPCTCVYFFLESL